VLLFVESAAAARVALRCEHFPLFVVRLEHVFANLTNLHVARVTEDNVDDVFGPRSEADDPCASKLHALFAKAGYATECLVPLLVVRVPDHSCTVDGSNRTLDAKMDLLPALRNSLIRRAADLVWPAASAPPPGEWH